jgi:hypothetical protein
VGLEMFRLVRPSLEEVLPGDGRVILADLAPCMAYTLDPHGEE